LCLSAFDKMSCIFCVDFLTEIKKLKKEQKTTYGPHSKGLLTLLLSNFRLLCKCLLWELFSVIGRCSPKYLGFFQRNTGCTIFLQKWIRLHFGWFFRKLIWSPCLLWSNSERLRTLSGVIHLRSFGLPNFSWFKHTKMGKIYQMTNGH
jgi:hypothetical protein